MCFEYILSKTPLFPIPASSPISPPYSPRKAHLHLDYVHMWGGTIVNSAKGIMLTMLKERESERQWYQEIGERATKYHLLSVA